MHDQNQVNIKIQSLLMSIERRNEKQNEQTKSHKVCTLLHIGASTNNMALL